MSVNKVTLLGNVGQTPTVKTFEGGGMVAQITLATSERGYKTQDGKEIPERTEWHNVVLRNGLAKVVGEYVHKGDKLYIEGKLRTRKYEAKDGEYKYITEVYADVLEMLTPKSGKDEKQPAAPIDEKSGLPF